jgi:hypothetical protein
MCKQWHDPPLQLVVLLQKPRPWQFPASEPWYLDAVRERYAMISLRSKSELARA